MFNFGHVLNLLHPLDCDLLVGRVLIFYFVISSFATGQSMSPGPMKLAARARDLSSSILVRTQSHLRPIAYMNGEIL